MKIILKNNTTLPIILDKLGKTLAAAEEYEVNRQSYSLISRQDTLDELSPYILSEDLIVNNGSVDLPFDVGINHIASSGGVEDRHEDITLLPGVGVNAPSFVEIDQLAAGHEMQINDLIYGQSRIDNYAGGNVTIQIHGIVDNDSLDRWIKFQLRIITTNGHGDKTLLTPDVTVTTDDYEVPDTPFLTFAINVDIERSYFQNGEKYLIFQIKRIDVSGKTSPTNNPVIWRYCKKYFRVRN